MKGYAALPECFGEILSVDLQKDRKKALLVNGLAALIAVIMVLAGMQIVPIKALFDMEQGIWQYILRFGVLSVGIFVYILLHEGVHGVFIYLFCGEKPSFGFTGMYAYAGSRCYFDKSSYLVIALAPVVVWGAVLFLLCGSGGEEWFWVWYIIQITNISGAAGDLYVTAVFSRLPRDILVLDNGVSMCVYAKNGQPT